MDPKSPFIFLIYGLGDIYEKELYHIRLATLVPD